MKKKSASRSAFFNFRVLMGVGIILAAVLLVLGSLGTFSALAQVQVKQKIITNSKDPLVPNGFDCSKIQELGIDRQENLRAGAIMMACGQAQRSATLGGMVSQAIQRLPIPSTLKKVLTPTPLAYGAADVDLVTGAETSPNITQSETFSTANPDNPNEIVVAMNDSRGRNFNPINISGASVSTDGGTTFTRLTKANGQGPFDNTLGDPVILYSRHSATWYTVWLDAGCGGQGLGGYKSTTPADPNSWTHFCVFNEGSADRESGWADNNPSSPHYGNLYVSWNDFAVGGGALFVRVSTDDGATWTPHQITSGTPFIRDVQITGDLVTGDVYIAGMNEGGGGTAGPRSNLMFRSTDGGNTWTNTYTGPTFTGPSDGTTCSSNSYFASMFSGYWRHMGWGEPAAINHVVHYVYAQHGAGADPGDIYYIRSTDSGVTFSAPLKLNTDSTTRPQWQPNLSVSPGGTVFATWYDARESTSCAVGNTSIPCYRMWGRKSNDNGVTWLPDDTFSDVVSPLPAQPDPGIVGCYVGDYDYGSAITTKHVSSWADGRVAIGGQSQQDAFTDRELVGFSVTTSDPACNSFVTTPPTDFIVNLSDPALPSSVQASDFTVNGTAANSFTLSNGNATITFHFNSTPVTTPGPQTMHIPAGAILRNSDSMPIFEFLCNFCYDTAQLQVTTTNPPVGGTFSPPAPGDYTYDVNWNLPVDPASVSTSDLTLTGNVGGSVTNVQVNGNTTTFTVHFNNGGSVMATIGFGSITAHTCNSNAAFSGNYTVEGPAPCFWSAGPNLPTPPGVLIRAVGVFFPADGNFYTMGGRTSDLAGSDFQHVLKYSPGSNTWTQQGVTLADNTGNNMACGVLTVSGTPLIYCVGGSAGGQTTATARVYSYNPATDTQTVLTSADNWPGDAAGTILPGGFAVANNKFYILGGFNINVASTNQIWQFDPTAAVGSKWTQMVNAPEGVMYAPTCTINGTIYLAGASDYQGGTVVDTTNSFSFDPVANTIGSIAPIPRATGETRGLNFCNKMYVMGGGRVAPNPSNEVDIYDPGTNTWSTGLPFVNARRNFPTDTDGTDNIWLAGGYEPATPAGDMEIFHCPVSPCGPSPTPTATATATPTPTATAMPRATPTPRPRPTPAPRP